MAKKDIPYLKVVKPPDNPKEVRKEAKRRKGKLRRAKFRRALVPVILAALAVCGTWLLLNNQTYGRARTASSFQQDLSDTNSYVQFADGIVRYNRDGVVYLNRKNEEQWIQPTQIQNPIIVTKEHAFAVADNGGNSIFVFSEEGLKGEIETNLPVERIAISDQGIVSAVLSNESSPQIVTYDAAGNILVEQQVTMSNTGYPIGLEMSDDGNVLAVTYLHTEGTNITSRVAYYNFGEAGQEQSDHRVTADTYSDTIMSEVFFMGNDRSVVVGDNSFVIYHGSDVPEKEKEVVLNQEIRSVFHSDKYIGFILLNQEKSGYELRLFNRSGDQVINREISGEYSNVKIDGDEVLLYEGTVCCIMTATGITKYQGDINTDILEMFRAPGLNRYYVMSVNELSVIYLTK